MATWLLHFIDPNTYPAPDPSKHSQLIKILDRLNLSIRRPALDYLGISSPACLAELSYSSGTLLNGYVLMSSIVISLILFFLDYYFLLRNLKF